MHKSRQISTETAAAQVLCLTGYYAIRQSWLIPIVASRKKPLKPLGATADPGGGVVIAHTWLWLMALLLCQEKTTIFSVHCLDIIFLHHNKKERNMCTCLPWKNDMLFFLNCFVVSINLNCIGWCIAWHIICFCLLFQTTERSNTTCTCIFSQLYLAQYQSDF